MIKFEKISNLDCRGKVSMNVIKWLFEAFKKYLNSLKFLITSECLN